MMTKTPRKNTENRVAQKNRYRVPEVLNLRYVVIFKPRRYAVRPISLQTQCDRCRVESGHL